TIVSVVTLVWGISPRQPSGKNIIRWLLKKRTNGSVRYCQYTSRLALFSLQAGFNVAVYNAYKN
ncbi:hypothetical protein, partial [Escherichia coli]|uniref:hypothetical protein n=1 Tax=Escherichia coli TaxID=562 RepID=UPI002542B786